MSKLQTTVKVITKTAPYIAYPLISTAASSLVGTAVGSNVASVVFKKECKHNEKMAAIDAVTIGVGAYIISTAATMVSINTIHNFCIFYGDIIGKNLKIASKLMK